MSNTKSKSFRIAGGNLNRVKHCEKTGRSAHIESLPNGYEVRMYAPPITVNKFIKTASTLKEARAIADAFIKKGQSDDV